MFTAIFAKGTDSKRSVNSLSFIDSAVLISADDGRIEQAVLNEGAAVVAEDLGLFDRERKGSLIKRKWPNGVYSITAEFDGDEFSNISIQQL